MNKDRVYQKYGYRCAYCGCGLKKSICTIDHIKSVYYGGSNIFDNLNPACHFCNALKGCLTLKCFRYKLLYLINNFSDIKHTDVLAHYTKSWNGQFYFERVNNV